MMVIRHAGKSPQVDPSAYVAPNAVLCGDVTVGPGSRVMFGAQVIAEGGSITIGRECIVMQNAVLRSTTRHSLSIGNNCLIGPNTHLAGCTIEDEVFIATGSAILHAARLGKGCEVRVNGIVQIRTELAAGATVPMGWVAVGTPAQLLPLEEHDKIWALQKPLDFPSTVYGIERVDADMLKITRSLSDLLGSHLLDEVEPGEPAGV
jgi:carbonic anhydrase/acetyltransferase-like protein (isoleucine patch superfamily)